MYLQRAGEGGWKVSRGRVTSIINIHYELSKMTEADTPNYMLPRARVGVSACNVAFINSIR